MLMRLIYASESRQSLTPESVQQLVDHASRSNRRRQLTGVLAFDQQSFLQCLEGDRESVSDTFCKIAADTRHHRVLLLDYQAINERMFCKWSMGFAAADAGGRELFLRFGVGDTFNPHQMSAGSALGFLASIEGRLT